MKAYLEANPRGRPESEFLSPRVFHTASGWVEWARTRAAVRARDRLLRRPRALGRARGGARHLRLADPCGVEPIQPFPTPGRAVARLGLSSALHRMSDLYSAESRWSTLAGPLPRRARHAGRSTTRSWSLSSDHGVLLGEYGWVGKRYTEVHPELCHVPFVIRHPAGKAKGQACRYLASHHDIGPTVLAALGYDNTDTMNGADLSRLLDGKQPAQKRPYSTSAYASYLAARDDSWLLISDNPGKRSGSTSPPRPRRPQRPRRYPPR